MNEKTIWIIAIIFMSGTIFIAVLGTYYPKLDIVFDVFLALWGAVAGFMIEAWFSEKSKKQELGKYSEYGYRMSYRLYQQVGETIQLIDEYQKRASIKKENIETVAIMLKMIESLASDSSDHWKDSLPKKYQIEANKKNEK